MFSRLALIVKYETIFMKTCVIETDRSIDKGFAGLGLAWYV